MIPTTAMLKNGMMFGLMIFFWIGAESHAAGAEAAVTVEHGVPMTTRDGVVLRADIYRPSASGQFPVLLERTPYNKMGGGDIGRRGAENGFVVIIQDVRGRFTSEGEWYPFKYEAQDGYDTVEWAATRPYANGKVGMFGGSYVGATQMLAAITHPPHLAGICPIVTASNYHDGWTYQGGAFEQWFNQSWTAGLAQDTLNRFVQTRTNAMGGASKLPLSSFPLFNIAPGELETAAAAQLAPYYLDWLAHPNDDDYWKRWSIEEHYADIQVPALSVAAWYDIFQGGSLRNFQGLQQHGGSDQARQGQHLLVTIGGHAGGGRKIGDVDFGPAAAEFNEDALILEWYEFLLKGMRNHFAEKPVRLFVMGRNEWRDETEWPLARAQSTRYYLHSAKGANALEGDGTLSTTAPKKERADQYVYNPLEPVATTGGPLCCDANHQPAGPKDQRPVEARKDVLVYSTPELKADLEVTGPVTLELYASSSAVDTDFTAKLVDVWPNGFAQNLTEGILRARYRNSQVAPELLNPGQVYKLAIDLWSTSNVFLRGHRIRVEIGSSNFPRFDRNLNTGEAAQFATRAVTAANVVYHDGEHQSAIVLPVAGSR